VTLLATALPLSPMGANAQQVTPCDGETDPYSTVAPGPYRELPPKVVYLKSHHGGVSIQLGILRPKVPAGMKVPVIVDASPYFHPLQSMDWPRCPRIKHLAQYVSHGFAVAALPVRGTGDSGGCMNFMGPGERADLNQAVTWLGRRSWSNGAVGMTGRSYDGSTPWEVAAMGNPHLKTIVPSEGVNNLFDLLFGGGTPDWRGPNIINTIYYLESGVFYAPGRRPQNTEGVWACPEYAVGNLASDYSAQTGELDPFGYWKARDYRGKVERSYKGSIFLLQGLQDWNVNPGLQFPWVNELDRSGLYVKYLLGQWNHAWPDDGPPKTRRTDFARILLNWFDYWLKGDHSAPLGPKVQVQDDRMQWRDASRWPPRGDEVTLWLTPGGRLSKTEPGGSGSVTVAADPAHTEDPAEAQGDGSSTTTDALQSRCSPPACAEFDGPKLGRDLRVAGIPTVRLRVTPAGPGGELSIYLYAVSGSDYRRIAWGQVDLRFPHGGRKSSKVTPGRATRARFPLQPLDSVVPAGSHLALVVSEGSAYNRLPSTPNYPAQIALGKNASWISVTRVQPAPGAFFTPPRRKEKR
jgi:predicted acyl esterase